LNNLLINTLSFIRKASFITCLLSLAFSCVHAAREWRFEATSEKAYGLTLNLKTTEARALIKEPRTISDYYVISLAEAIELLISEDPQKFSEYQRSFEERKEKKIKCSDADYQFYQAELRLQWTFIYLKFGYEFDAALNLKQAYQISTTCRKKNPAYLPIRKTIGLLEVMIGSVPEKYNWVLALLGMHGSIQKGLDDLNSVSTTDSPFAFEANIINAVIHGFVFQRPDKGLEELKKLQTEKTDNNLVRLLTAILAIKNSESEIAFQMLNTLSQPENGLPLLYVDYLKGEVYLYKADYLNAISSYRWFTKNYNGQNYVKDAHYKIGLCYWLNGNKNDALEAFEEAKVKGKETTEADKHAAKSLAEKELPHVKLSKVRYFTDGGYYAEAKTLLESITPTDLPSRHNQVEYYYRKARLAHKQLELPAAKLFYSQTIEMAGEEHWYFAPNACLQLGYIAWQGNNISEAVAYFEKALRYKKHEYKNSIDSKAKTALAQIKRK
jgi:tetratricopeptide (TPR) repeat protein